MKNGIEIDTSRKSMANRIVVVIIGNQNILIQIQVFKTSLEVTIDVVCVQLFNEIKIIL